ncbi:Sec-independent protein translocase protein TatB [Hyphococcus flavus]|uniref:Sec-independent protein translocase protein TatB n=1 Tax=Hyphococcus flavus TaxID=1866326 RepID=A0AAE9ZGX5_9PROT|nr:Sec-independent protein translocase protein TatB [Hyphococcus flavus]WDI30636.1 Sec-independent protein translocase protein TatB [Hyphococcus flavus]
MSLVPQFGFFELMLIAVVALIVVGPKDLPKLMRSAGRMVAKARQMAGEFTAAFDQMAREAEMEELRKEIDDLKKNNPVADAKRAFDETTAPIDKELREEARELNEAVNKSVGDTQTDKTKSDTSDQSAAASEPAKS